MTEQPAEQTFGLYKDDPPSPEAPQPAPPPAPEPDAQPQPSEADARLSRGWEDINRRDRELVRKQQELSELSKELESLKRAKGLAESDKLAAVRAMGIDTSELLTALFDQPTEEQAKEPTNGVDQKVLAEIEAVKKQLAEQRRLHEQSREELDLYRTRTELLKEIGSHDGLDIIKTMSADRSNSDPLLNSIIQAAKEEQRATGEAPDWSDLLARTEAIIEEKCCKYIDDMLKYEKIRARYGINSVTGDSPVPSVDAKKPAPKPSTPPRTLSNQLNAEPPVDRDRKLSLAEREERSLQILAKAWKRD